MNYASGIFSVTNNWNKASARLIKLHNVKCLNVWTGTIVTPHVTMWVNHKIVTFDHALNNSNITHDLIKILVLFVNIIIKHEFIYVFKASY